MKRMLIGLAVCALTLAAQAHATTPSVGDLLNQVTVVPAIDHHPGYQRSCRGGEGCVFGPAWNDPNDHSGCDTRSRVLAAQLSDVTFMDGHGCKIASGTLVDPTRGRPSSRAGETGPASRSTTSCRWPWPGTPGHMRGRRTRRTRTDSPGKRAAIDCVRVNVDVYV